MLFPDEYTHPEGVELPIASSINVYSLGYGTTYTIADWKALQNAGCVFLPPAGSRNFVSGKISYTNTGGGDAYYAVAGSTSFWTSSSYTYYDENGVASNVSAFTYDCSPSVNPRTPKSYGRAVRLVQDRQ